MLGDIPWDLEEAGGFEFEKNSKNIHMAIEVEEDHGNNKLIIS